MKLVTAIVRPHVLEDVKRSLQDLGVAGLTLTEVRGYGRQRGHTEVYRGAEYEIEFVPKLRVDAFVPEELVDDVVDVIATAARSGQVGDGKIVVTPIERLVRIRTGEEDRAAL